MAEVVCGGVIFSESEFLPNEIYFGKCGQNMQAMLQSWATQKYRSTQDVYVAMRKAGRCDLDGVSVMSQQVAQAKADGFKVEVLATNTSMPESAWSGFLHTHLPAAAVGVEVANGQALKDELTGLREDATNLKFHFFSIFGHHDGGPSARAGGRTLPAGWWCADGDNYSNNTHTASGWNRHLGGHTLQFYSEETLRAARPCAALAMYPKATIGGSQMGVPQGWHDDEARETLTAPNGIAVTQGMRKFVLAQSWDAGNWPLEEKQYSGDLAHQTFRRCKLYYHAANGVYFGAVGQELLDAQKAQSAPPSAPAVDPIAANALAVLQALKAALGEL